MTYAELALAHLPSPYASLLIERMGEKVSSRETGGSSRQLLKDGVMKFPWARSKEGSCFWEAIYRHLACDKQFRNGHPLPKLPALESEPIRKTPDQAQPKQNNDMLNKYATTPVATPTLIYGTDVSSMDEASVMSAIKGLKAEIKDLQESGISSRRVDELIAGKNAAVAKLIERLDSFATAPATPAS